MNKYILSIETKKAIRANPQLIADICKSREITPLTLYQALYKDTAWLTEVAVLEYLSNTLQKPIDKLLHSATNIHKALHEVG